MKDLETGRPNIITSTLNSARGDGQGRGEGTMEKGETHGIASFEDGGRDPEPRVAGGLWESEWGGNRSLCCSL